jgi:UDP-N-acetylglucosamine:LPS N-acetylglucosamine transferase
VRVLILTASVGEGHDLPARLLGEQISRQRPDVDVRIEDGLQAMGWFVRLISEDAPRIVFFRLRWLWDAAFWTMVEVAPTRALAQRLLNRLGGGKLLRLIDSFDPDVVVSVYPQTTEVIGALRRSGRLRVPAVGAITDIAALDYWAARGIDLHLLVFEDSIAEVKRVAGTDGAIRVVRGFTRPEFHEPRDRADARRALGVEQNGKLVLVSGGGWGVGDLEGAVEAALRDSDVTSIVCLCGRNDELQARLRARFSADPRVRVEGFTEEMNDWLAAADALIHSTGGLTVFEAHMRGCPTISYGWGRGHLRRHNEAFAKFGFADVVARPSELPAALSRAFASGRGRDLSYSTLPSAADLVVELGESNGTERD